MNVASMEELDVRAVHIQVQREFNAAENEYTWDVPDGKYEGVWHGEQVAFKHGDTQYMIEVSEGMPGFANVWVHIEGGKLRFTERL